MDNGVTGGGYITTQSGICKVAGFIFSLAAFISMMIFSDAWRGDMYIFFDLTCLFGVIYTLAMIVTSVGNLGSTNSEWHKVDIIVCIILSHLAFISASICALFFEASKNFDAFRAAVILQYFNGFAFLGNSILKIMR